MPPFMSNSATHGFTRFEAALPALKLTNADTRFAPYGKQSRRAGVDARHIARNNETIESLAINALEKVLQQETRQCTALILSTTAADHDEATNPEDMAKKIAAHFDIEVAYAVNMACSGFSAAIAKAMQLATEHDDIAVVSSEIASRGLDFDDPGSFLLFGDAAAATTVSRHGPHTIEKAYVQEFDDPDHFLDAKRGTYKDFDGIVSDRSVFRMSHGKPATIPGMTEKNLTIVAAEAMGRNVLRELEGVNAEDIVINPHQASQPVLDQLDSFLWNQTSTRFTLVRAYRETGNTVSASVPLALATIQDEIRAGTLVLCPTAGGGHALREGKMTHGMVRIRW